MSLAPNNLIFTNSGFDAPRAIVNASGFTVVVFQCIGTSNSPAISEDTDGTAATLFDCDLFESSNPGTPPCERSRNLVRCEHFATFATLDPITAECPPGSLLRIAAFPDEEASRPVTVEVLDSESTFGPVTDFDGNVAGSFEGRLLSSTPGVDVIFTMGTYGSFVNVSQRCDAWNEDFYFNGELTTSGHFIYDNLFLAPCEETCPATTPSNNGNGGDDSIPNEEESSCTENNSNSLRLAQQSLSAPPSSDDAFTFVVDRPEVANAIFDLVLRGVEFLLSAALLVVFAWVADNLVSQGRGIHPVLLDALGGHFSIVEPLKSKSLLGGMVAAAAIGILVLESTLEFGFIYRSVIVRGNQVAVWDALNINFIGMQRLLECQLFKECEEEDGSAPLMVVAQANTATVSGSPFFSHAPFGTPIRSLGGGSCLFGGELVDDAIITLPRYRPLNGDVASFSEGGDVGVFQSCERNATSLSLTLSLEGHDLDALLEGFTGPTLTPIWGYVDPADNPEIAAVSNNQIEAYDVQISASFDTPLSAQGVLVLQRGRGTFNTLGSEGWYSAVVPTNYCTPSANETIEWFGAETEDGRPYSLDLLLGRSQEDAGICVLGGPVRCVHDDQFPTVDGNDAQCLLYGYTASAIVSDVELAPALACALGIADTRGTSERALEAFLLSCSIALSGESQAAGDKLVIELQIQWWLVAIVLGLTSVSTIILVLGCTVLRERFYKIPTTVYQGYEFGLTDAKFTAASRESCNDEFHEPPKNLKLGLVQLDQSTEDHLGMTMRPKEESGRKDKNAAQGQVPGVNFEASSNQDPTPGYTLGSAPVATPPLSEHDLSESKKRKKKKAAGDSVVPAIVTDVDPSQTATMNSDGIVFTNEVPVDSDGSYDV